MKCCECKWFLIHEPGCCAIEYFPAVKWNEFYCCHEPQTVKINADYYCSHFEKK